MEEEDCQPFHPSWLKHGQDTKVLAITWDHTQEDEEPTYQACQTRKWESLCCQWHNEAARPTLNLLPQACVSKKSLWLKPLLLAVHFSLLKRHTENGSTCQPADSRQQPRSLSPLLFPSLFSCSLQIWFPDLKISQVTLLAPFRYILQPDPLLLPPSPHVLPAPRSIHIQTSPILKGLAQILPSSEAFLVSVDEPLIPVHKALDPSHRLQDAIVFYP
jgi:hypothetical protein